MKNRSAPTATVVPILIYEDVGQAIEWLCRAFGFTARLRAESDGVIGHAQLDIAEGAVILGRQGGPYRAPHGHEVRAHVHVPSTTSTSISSGQTSRRSYCAAIG